MFLRLSVHGPGLTPAPEPAPSTGYSISDVRAAVVAADGQQSPIAAWKYFVCSRCEGVVSSRQMLPIRDQLGGGCHSCCLRRSMSRGTYDSCVECTAAVVTNLGSSPRSTSRTHRLWIICPSLVIRTEGGAAESSTRACRGDIVGFYVCYRRQRRGCVHQGYIANYYFTARI